MAGSWYKRRVADPITLCMRKRRYEAAEADKRAREYTRINASNGDGPCRAYLCPYCRGWHITRGEAGRRLQTLPPPSPAKPKQTKFRQFDFQKDRFRKGNDGKV